MSIGGAYDMNRRELISLLVGAGIALPARMEAQQSQYVPTIGFLHPGSPEAGSPIFDALQEGLRDVGYAEGDNIKLEVRWARGSPKFCHS